MFNENKHRSINRSFKPEELVELVKEYNKPQFSARDFANRIGVSVEQVYNAVYRLRKVGAPITRKQAGGGKPYQKAIQILKEQNPELFEDNQNL